ncbi:hypothetical protein AVEN_160763-1 [Araneus ventricosus]|uniref:Uncharacterized protein n=1 Tax=Araneus ventricosus TaxID=182803 RepID=A0A4Y2UM27_ARAVE|nr:hypothetical protein AVEN_160763-1 [Araneus ventricosus]
MRWRGSETRKNVSTWTQSPGPGCELSGTHFVILAERKRGMSVHLFLILISMGISGGYRTEGVDSANTPLKPFPGHKKCILFCENSVNDRTNLLRRKKLQLAELVLPSIVFTGY